MIPNHIIEEIRNRSDIVEVISSYLPLKKRGNNYIACCPFHQEKTPSFTASTVKQMYHCFGCGVSGDAVKFIMDHTGLDFVSALERLASICGVTIQYIKPQNSDSDKVKNNELIKKKPSLNKIMIDITDIYQQNLTKIPVVGEYVNKREISKESISIFSIGYATNMPLTQLKDIGAHIDDLITLGMIVTDNEHDRVYNRFNERLTFPIKNIKGEIIAFGGRTLNPEIEPKYLNSANTVLFDKSQELYGLYQSLKTIKDKNSVIVVEGYMDVVMMHQFGFTNAVASMGTSITELQIKKLFRYADNVYFMFDGDKAGKKAAWRALEISLPLVQDHKQIHFIFLPDGEDPDSILKSKGSDLVSKIIERDVVSQGEFLIRYLSLQVPDLKKDSGKSRLISLLRPYYAQLQGMATKALLVQSISELINLESYMIEQILLNQNNSNRVKYRDSSDVLKADRLKNIVHDIILLFIQKYQIQYYPIDSSAENISCNNIDNIKINEYQLEKHDIVGKIELLRNIRKYISNYNCEAEKIKLKEIFVEYLSEFLNTNLTKSEIKKLIESPSFNIKNFLQQLEYSTNIGCNETEQNELLINQISIQEDKLKQYFFHSNRYCNIDGFDVFIFNFSELLNNIDHYFDQILSVNNGNYLECYEKFIKIAKKRDRYLEPSINYRLFVSKDAKYAWRELKVINPVVYVVLVRLVSQHWCLFAKFLQDRTLYEKSSQELHKKIMCVSHLRYTEQSNAKYKGRVLKTYWEEKEQKSIQLSMQYKYVLNTDITDCYPGIYTHSVAWAICGGKDNYNEFCKIRDEKNRKIRDEKKLDSIEINGKKFEKSRVCEVAQMVDECLQAMSKSQTKGIPQGSDLMDLIAELVLADIDNEIFKSINSNVKDWQIIRYRDDYSIFVNNEEDGQTIILRIADVLSKRGLHLSTHKTKISQDIINGSIKSDKYELITEQHVAHDNSLQKQILYIKNFADKHQNSGRLIILMKEFYNYLIIAVKDTGRTEFQKYNKLESILAIVIEIMKSNPKVYKYCVAVIEQILNIMIRFNNDQENRNINKVKYDIKFLVCNILNKSKQISYHEMLLLWLYRVISVIPDSIKQDLMKDIENCFSNKGTNKFQILNFVYTHSRTNGKELNNETIWGDFFEEQPLLGDKTSGQEEAEQKKKKPPKIEEFDKNHQGLIESIKTNIFNIKSAKNKIMHMISNVRYKQSSKEHLAYTDFEKNILNMKQQNILKQYIKLQMIFNKFEELCLDIKYDNIFSYLFLFVDNSSLSSDNSNHNHIVVLLNQLDYMKIELENIFEIGFGGNDFSIVKKTIKELLGHIKDLKDLYSNAKINMRNLLQTTSVTAVESTVNDNQTQFKDQAVIHLKHLLGVDKLPSITDDNISDESFQDKQIEKIMKRLIEVINRKGLSRKQILETVSLLNKKLEEENSNKSLDSNIIELDSKNRQKIKECIDVLKNYQSTSSTIKFNYNYHILSLIVRLTPILSTPAQEKLINPYEINVVFPDDYTG